MEERVLRVVKENLGYEIDRDLVLDESISSLQIDSITFIRIIVALEEEFGIEVEDEKLILEDGKNVSYFLEMVQV